ncbi:MAG: hypothetical protein FWE67_10480, partial [Planctomycetaceae bacterium]|nr:hypothetical protein [Planctomycetaceae bacterium]
MHTPRERRELHRYVKSVKIRYNGAAMSDMLFYIPKDLLAKLHNANSEATVRQLVMQQLDCDEITLEEGRTDVYHKNVLFEFKHDVDMSQPDGDRAKVLAQALYYCKSLYVDGRIKKDGTGRV